MNLYQFTLEFDSVCFQMMAITREYFSLDSTHELECTPDQWDDFVFDMSRVGFKVTLVNEI